MSSVECELDAAHLLSDVPCSLAVPSSCFRSRSSCSRRTASRRLSFGVMLSLLLIDEVFSPSGYSFICEIVLVGDMLVDIIRDIQLQESLSRFRFGFWDRRLSRRLCRCLGWCWRVENMFRLWHSRLRWCLRRWRLRGVRFRRGWSDTSIPWRNLRRNRDMRWSRDMSERAYFSTDIFYD